MSKQVRVRFAPSPSGSLHIGGARTALFNWAWAKKNGGKLIVRVEDTDAERSIPESKQIILDSLRWLGLDWQEGVEVGGDCGPYQQSERKDIYLRYAEKLIAEGKAYRCYCTEDDLAKARDEWKQHNPKIGFKYPGTCRNKPNNSGVPHVIRLVATREGTTEFVDHIFGKVSTPNIENQDWVIIRTDGLPLYNYGAVLDDALMGITLVARGADHLQNTIPQLLMYQALGFEPPEFCHMPLIRGQDNEKLSKRHASVAVFEYRDQGFAPSALLNYLSRLGWSKGNAEVFSLKEFADDLFDWTGCGKNDGKWDPAKLAAINYAHLKSPVLVPDDEYLRLLDPFLLARGFTNLDKNRVKSLIPVIRDRAKTLVDAAAELDPFLRKDITVDPPAKEKFLTAENKAKLVAFSQFLSGLDTWGVETLKERSTNWMTENGTSLKEIGQAVRVAVVGRTSSPELFATMAALGKETTLARLKNHSA
jgi:glutamyl-tRNA synthetase